MTLIGLGMERKRESLTVLEAIIFLSYLFIVSALRELISK